MTGLDILIIIIFVILIAMIIWYIIWIFGFRDEGHGVGGSCSTDSNCRNDLFCDRQGFCQCR